MKIEHPALVSSLRKAYSAEKAAAVAYIGHAGSLRNQSEKTAIQQIEKDEWEHREHVLRIMQQYEISVSRYYEFKCHITGSIICYLFGRFIPYLFSRKLESGNVC